MNREVKAFENFSLRGKVSYNNLQIAVIDLFLGEGYYKAFYRRCFCKPREVGFGLLWFVMKSTRINQSHASKAQCNEELMWHQSNRRNP